jgi:hypothetical protein
VNYLTYIFLLFKIKKVKAVEAKKKRVYSKKLKGGSDHFEKA